MSPGRPTIQHPHFASPGKTFAIDGSYAMVSPDEAVNRYTAAPGEVSREYDANGNLTKVTTTAGTREMAYDHGNRMVRFTDEDGNVARYDYDPFGRRVRKITHVNTQAEEETRFVLHGQRVIEERDENNTVQRSFAWGIYIDELVNTRDGVNQDPAAGDDHWYFTDHLYSVVAVVDNEGDLAERYEYSDYGLVAAYAPNGDFLEQSALENRTLFTGRELDPESGYYHYRTRTYDPRDGRFTSIDSIGVWGDPVNLGNGYAYVGNGPGGRVDPMGEQNAPILTDLLDQLLPPPSPRSWDDGERVLCETYCASRYAANLASLWTVTQPLLFKCGALISVLHARYCAGVVIATALTAVKAARDDLDACLGRVVI